MWYKDLVDRLAKFGYEMVRTKGNTGILFIGPNALDEDTQKSIIELVPEEERHGSECHFVETIKESTKQALSQILNFVGVVGIEGSVVDRSMHLRLFSSREIPEGIWEQVDRLFRNDKYLNTWRITLNGKDIHHRDVDREEDDMNYEETDDYNALGSIPSNGALERAAEVAREERLACDRTHPPSHAEIDQMKTLLDQCDDFDTLIKLL